MKRATLLALLSHWRRNPLQCLTLLAGLALATALWSGVQAINSEARASYDAAAATLGEGQYEQLLLQDRSTIPQEVFVALRRGGWLVSPVVEGRINGVRLIGIEPLTAPGGLGPVTVLDGTEITAFLGGQGQVFGRPDVLARLSDLPTEGIAAPDIAPGTAITDIGVAQRLLGMEGQVSRLIMLPEQPLLQTALDEVAPGIVRRAPETGSDIGRLTDSFHLNLTAFGALSFAVGIFIVHGAVGLAFEQRRPVVRTLRALGVPLATLIGLMAFELLLFAIVAGVAGLVIGYGIAAALLPDVAGTLRGIYGADVAGDLQFRIGWALSGIGIALAGTAVAATAAMTGIARMPILATAQARALTMRAGGQARVQGLLAIVLFALGAIILPRGGGGLIGGFALLGCLLIGAALAMPFVLDRLLAVGAALARAPLPQWFWADTRQQLPGLSLALAALLLAMAANVGVSTMVSSFRLTFTGFLDQRLASELYVYADDTATAAAIEQFVAPRVEAVLPLLSQERRLAGMMGEVYGARDHATYRDNWQFITAVPGVWDRLATGQGVLVNEQLARRAGLSLNDALTLIPGTDLPVIGIYGDYGNAAAQAIVTESVFRALFPDVTPTRFGLRLSPDEVPALRMALQDEFGLSEANMINQSALKAFSMEIFERTFAVTTALNILTLSVAGFAMLMSLLTLAGMRLPQLAPVWAMGLTRASLGRLELLRAVLLAALTAVLALPLGLALAWVLLAVVNVEAFGWRLPMFLFPVDYLRLGAFALVAAVFAALWPAVRLARTPPTALLKVFANER
jgi:putative ABC transport system permease protein